MKPSQIIILEGAKNVGKTYLIDNCEILNKYKFPFERYFNTFMKNNTDNVGTGDKATYHFTTSFDITLHSMANQGLFNDPVLVDRGFLSNIVLGVIQKRITDTEALSYIDFIYNEGYLSPNLRIVYIMRGAEGGRTNPKDQWEYLASDELHTLYVKYIKYIKDTYNFECEIFVNNFDSDSLLNFKNVILPTNNE